MKIQPVGAPITPVSRPVAAPIKSAKTPEKATPTPTPATPVLKKDSAVLSEAGKDLAAQMSGKTVAEEAKESPVTEAREEQGKAGAK